jgi:hypothetical protein
VFRCGVATEGGSGDDDGSSFNASPVFGVTGARNPPVGE